MAVPDTSIDDWTTAANTNLPTDATFIGRDLAPQIQNMKAVVRGETLDKEFEKVGKRTAGATGGDPSSISFFEADGNLVSTFPVSRKVRLRPADGTSSYVYCGVAASSFVGNTTSVTLANLSGSVLTGEEYFVDVGVAKPGTDPLPLYVQSGTVSVANTDTNATATFAHIEPDTDYFARIQILSDTTGMSADVRRVAQLGKAASGLTITLKGAPGNGNTIVLGWTIMRAL